MKSRALVIGLLAAGLCGAAQAEEQGFYAGSGAGLYYVDIDGADFDETATTVRLFGGFALNEYVSFEAGYSHLFEASSEVNVPGVGDVDLDFDGSSFDISVRPSLPLSDNVTAFGILGWSRYDIEVTASEGGISASEDGSDNDLMYGLGGAVDLNDNWKLRGEWTVIDIEDADFGMFSVSAVYNFR